MRAASGNMEERLGKGTAAKSGHSQLGGLPDPLLVIPHQDAGAPLQPGFQLLSVQRFSAISSQGQTISIQKDETLSCVPSYSRHAPPSWCLRRTREQSISHCAHGIECGASDHTCLAGWPRKGDLGPKMMFPSPRTEPTAGARCSTDCSMLPGHQWYSVYNRPGLTFRWGLASAREETKSCGRVVVRACTAQQTIASACNPRPQEA